MRWLAIFVTTLLFASTIPVSSAGGNGLHWNGYGLERGAVPNVVLTDENNEPYSLHTGDAEVNVVAFIFTTCADACPILTHNLAQAHAELDDVDHQFISITVDPEFDTPSVLKEYMEDRSVSWPHLSGSYEEIKAIWDNFQINVTVTEIEVADNNHSHEDSSDNQTSSQEEESSSREDHGDNDTQEDRESEESRESEEHDHSHGDEEIDREDHGDNATHEDSEPEEDRESEEHDHSHGDEETDREDRGDNDTQEDRESEESRESEEHDHSHGDEETEDDGIVTLISHSTQTFILDSNWKPKVVFVGYMWNVDVFVQDVVRAAGLHTESSDHDSDILPGFTFTAAVSGLGLAIIAASRDD